MIKQVSVNNSREYLYVIDNGPGFRKLDIPTSARHLRNARPSPVNPFFTTINGECYE